MASAAVPAAKAPRNLVRRRISGHRLLDMRQRHRAIERSQRQHRADDDHKDDEENQDRARQLGILQEFICGGAFARPGAAVYSPCRHVFCPAATA